jgi:acyl dehydratase
MPNLGAHGFQILIQSAAGAGWFPHYVEDSMKGFIEQSSKFLKPVYVGDTLYPSLKVSKLDCGKTTGVVTLASTILNQRDELVNRNISLNAGKDGGGFRFAQHRLST